VQLFKFRAISVFADESAEIQKVKLAKTLENEKDSSTVDLTIRPLSGAEGCGSAFLSSDGGA
jgi:hypothetical protein